MAGKRAVKVLTLRHEPRLGIDGRTLEVQAFPDGAFGVGPEPFVSLTLGLDGDPRKLGYSLTPAEAERLADALRSALSPRPE